jgi:cell division protein FtsQ
MIENKQNNETTFFSPSGRTRGAYILQIILWTLTIVGVVVVLGFVNKSQKDSIFDPANVYVDIDYETENRFVDEDGVKSYVVNAKDTLKKYLGDYDVLSIEQKINGNSAIKDAQVYKTIDGKIIVRVKQRRPIARVFAKNESYYIDEYGSLMPLSNKYTSRVVVVSGRLNEPFASRYKFNYQNLPDSLASKTMLDDLFILANYIDKSSFWKAQIEQVYVNKDLDLELIPKVGNHKIVLGGVDNLDNKFARLMVFYKKGLPKTGWNEYSEVNLKFKNQIVCTKIYN